MYFDYIFDVPIVTMGRRTGALLWKTVDAMVTNREVRLENEQSEWDVVDEWLRHYQNAQRKKATSPTPGTSALPNRKTNKKKLLKSSSRQHITHKSVPGYVYNVSHKNSCTKYIEI